MIEHEDQKKGKYEEVYEYYKNRLFCPICSNEVTKEYINKKIEPKNKDEANNLHWIIYEGMQCECDKCKGTFYSEDGLFENLRPAYKTIIGMEYFFKNKKNIKNKKTNKGINKKTRYKILEKYNSTCQKCGRTIKDGVKLEVDHIYPKSKGGSDNEENLTCLCCDCNVGKSDIIYQQQKI